MEGPVFEAMFAAITRHRAAYRFHLVPDRLDGDWSLDGDADDGFGPGRLYISVTVKPGNLMADPCADREFTQGGVCVQRRLANGDRLSLRDLVEANGTQTVVVALIHPDRSGITAEASNFSIAGLRGPISPGQDPIPPRSRVSPVYTVTELAELVLAIDRGLRGLVGR